MSDDQHTTELPGNDVETHDDPPGGGNFLLSSAEAPDVRARNRRRSVLVLLGALLVVFALRPVPALLIQAGPAYPVAFTEEPDQVADTEGTWRFTTVSVTELNGAEWLFAKLSGRSADLVPDQGADRAERNAADALAMRNSKRVAWAVANQVLGTTDVATPNGALITSVQSGSPAAASAVPTGGRIVAVDDTEVLTASDLADAVAATDGQKVTLEVVDGPGDPRRIPVTPASVDGEWRIGVEVTDSAETTDPTYDIDSTGVGGPSAGMMFTLAYIDALSPGDLTAGRDLAGSGTIAPDGTVGPVGGVGHKVRGALAAGADVFFTSSQDPAPQTAGIEVVEVETVADAITWLCANGATDDVCLRDQPS